MSGYSILAGGRLAGSHLSLVMACGAARDLARATVGLAVTVERDGVEHARYRLPAAGKALERWVR